MEKGNIFGGKIREEVAGKEAEGRQSTASWLRNEHPRCGDTAFGDSSFLTAPINATYSTFKSF